MALQDELLSIPGIDSAELDGRADAPEGVRVKLAVGADPAVVGRAVQRVLASHGMQSQVSPPRVEPAEPPPPPGAEEPGAEAEAATPDVEEEPAEGGPSEEATESAAQGEEAFAAVEESVEGLGRAGGEEVGEELSVASGASRVETVAIEEARDSLTVRVRDNLGDEALRTLAASAQGIDVAVIEAVTDILLGSGHTVVVKAIEHLSVAGVGFLSVVVEIDGGPPSVGSSSLQGGRAFSVASAAWAAISSLG